MIHKHEIIKYGGIALIAGSILALVADVVGILVVEDHNPIRQTVSQLAHGKYAYIQDIGLALFGVGILIAGATLYLWKSDAFKCEWGATLLSIMGICIVVLAEFNEFAGTPGTTVHIVLAVFIGVLFMLCTFLIGLAFKKINKNWYYASIGMGILFLVSCSGFLVISQAYQGAYERGVIQIVLIWFCAMGYQMIKYPEKTMDFETFK
ncbi:DUF998 domain-containing protein [Subsaximicrobium wynnwilliamsii]|uniref:DUF998 domain-containing protein n=1 Tax=Subsaximicrobium wynnwilliamsii TaxID=291179 RepID=A0A5C6ZK09_9FLAO|nr:DUF998 domain-containing protein [Subsaximicrobium wynnwilliamsii]TXD84271.1 DUF998 domain-containing protein [Subsaximicrobium wynnwilliamsii]TXD89892.1 DUF998 domain-containing protein [Subsaximicrobium wynnwilliamsii]TXE03983.1 DUF998 domain-containing protein [Subsaximicrobium wynnwilliamsii]